MSLSQYDLLFWTFLTVKCISKEQFIGLSVLTTLKKFVAYFPNNKINTLSG